jgi:hypothetical protein
LRPEHRAAIQDSVRQFLAEYRTVLLANDFRGSLRFFSQDSAIVWVVDDGVLFLSYDSLAVAVPALAGRIHITSYQWNPIRITPLAPGVAVVSATYTESFTDTEGKPHNGGGTQTAVLVHGPEGWVFLARHQS